MIIGFNSKDNDLTVNPIKTKQLTNFRSTSSDEATVLITPLKLTLEKAIEMINEDELIENIEFVTSSSVFRLLQGEQNGSENILKNKEKLAELLFDCVGPRFIHTILTEDDRDHKDITKKFWSKICQQFYWKSPIPEGKK